MQRRTSAVDIVLIAGLGVTAVAVAVGSIGLAVSWGKMERQTAREASAIRTEMRLQEARMAPDAAGASSGESQTEHELNGAMHHLARVESDDPLPVDERMQRLMTAYAVFDAYLKSKPDHGPTLFRRGRCADLMGRLPEALADYRKAIEVEPKLTKDLAPRIRELGALLGK